MHYQTFSITERKEQHIPPRYYLCGYMDVTRCSANFLERREGEVRRTPLPRTRMNRGNREGWVQGKPTSNSGKEKEPLGSKTHAANTIARADELTVNSWRSSGQNAPTTH